MLNRSKTAPVLLVTDNPSSASDIALADSLGADLIDIDSFASSHIAADPDMVFAIDLNNLDYIRHLKGVLEHPGLGCRIFLIGNKTRVATVHANVLGANLVLPHPASAADVSRALSEHGAAAKAQRDMQTIQHSIQTGVGALSLGFQSLNDNVALDSKGITAASEQIAEAISLVGVEEWLSAVRGHHVGTFQHCMLVTGVATAFGSKSGMAKKDVATLTLAALLHDIGKAAVPIAILDKPGALDADETAVMNRHPVTGYDYLAKHSTIAKGVLRSVRHHHEFLDGSGYPDQLSGPQVDDLTRIITVCDIYAALVEKRSYKPAKSPKAALAILKSMAEAGKVEASLVRELGRIMLPSKDASAPPSR